MEPKTREPIISVLGHVDTGKTTLLDFIRDSTVASRESGGITQHIGATDVPFEVVSKLCGHLLEKLDLKISIRGLLFIDTPGHEAFTNLRRRGGSVADLAILIVDINKGLMPQSIEAMEILKTYKTPFVIAANKIDTIQGWIRDQNLGSQQEHVKEKFLEKFYKLIGQVSEHGFDSELFNKVDDFTKQVAIVPVSAKTGAGVPELMMVLVGLTQQYLAEKLSIDITTPGKGTILEVKEELGLGTTIDVILYEGVIKRGDSIVVGAREPIVTKVKALLRPKSLDEMRDPREKFKNVNEVYAAFGVKIAAPGLEKALAGAPVYVGGQELVEGIKGEIGEIEISDDILGVIVKADTLGSLEALNKFLSQQSIPVKRGSIGKVGKQDVVEASAVRRENKYLGVVIAFNSEVLDDAKAMANGQGVKIFESKVIYKIFEDYEEWVKKEREADKLKREKEIVTPAKFKLLPKHTFRQSKPAIVGVEVLVGTVRCGYQIMRQDGKVVGKIRGIQSEGESVQQANAGEKVAVSIDDVTIGRQLHEGDVVYSFVSSEDMAKIDKDELSDEEKQVIRELRDIRRSKNG